MKALELESPELQEVAKVLARASGVSLATGLIRTLRRSFWTREDRILKLVIEAARSSRAFASSTRPIAARYTPTIVIAAITAESALTRYAMSPTGTLTIALANTM